MAAFVFDPREDRSSVVGRAILEGCLSQPWQGCVPISQIGAKCWDLRCHVTAKCHYRVKEAVLVIPVRRKLFPPVDRWDN